MILRIIIMIFQLPTARTTCRAQTTLAHTTPLATHPRVSPTTTFTSVVTTPFTFNLPLEISSTMPLPTPLTRQKVCIYLEIWYLFYHFMCYFMIFKCICIIYLFIREIRSCFLALSIMQSFLSEMQLISGNNGNSLNFTLVPMNTADDISGISTSTDYLYFFGTLFLYSSYYPIFILLR